MTKEIAAQAEVGPFYRSPIDQIRFLITGEQTGGAFFMAEVSVPPGCGNPPHIHTREEETFYLQQGTLTVQVSEKTVTASAGDAICLPKGVAHSFQNNGNMDVKALLVAIPGGSADDRNLLGKGANRRVQVRAAVSSARAAVGKTLSTGRKLCRHVPDAKLSICPNTPISW